MRKIQITAMLAAAALMAAGCSTTPPEAQPSGPAGTPAGDKTQINLWGRLGDWKQDIVDKYNASQDRIQVNLTLISDDQYVNKVGSGVRSSNGPDILDLDNANASLFGATGTLLDITDRVQALGVDDWTSQGSVEVGQYDGRTYSVPFITGLSHLLYNKTLYQQAGLPDRAPTTWAEMRSDAEAVAALGGDISGIDLGGACGGCLSFAVQPMIWASDGTTMTAPGPEQTTTYSTSPPVAETFEFWRGMVADGLTNPGAETEAGATWGQDFMAGKVGIALGGGWLYTALKATGAEVGVAPIPGKDGGYASFAGGDNVGITATSKNPDAAWEVIQYLISEEPQLHIWETAGEMPARNIAITDQMRAENPQLELMGVIGAQSVAPASVAYNALQLSASSPWLAAFQAIVFQGADTKATLEKADQESRQLIVQAYEQLVQ